MQSLDSCKYMFLCGGIVIMHLLILWIMWAKRLRTCVESVSGLEVLFDIKHIWHWWTKLYSDDETNNCNNNNNINNNNTNYPQL